MAISEKRKAQMRARNTVNRARDKAAKRKWYLEHKEECVARVKAYRAANPEKARAWRRKAKTGFSPEFADKLFKAQGGVCAICKAELDFYKANADHDHDTGKPRGFLCGRCNRGIGILGDNVEGVQRVMNYFVNPPAEYLV